MSLSAKTLGIAEWEREALEHVAADLRRPGATLDMRHVGEGIGAAVLAFGQACGEVPARMSAACYLVPWERVASPALRFLYAPGAGTTDVLGHPGWAASAPEGARAIDRFLAGAGRRCWDFSLAQREAA